MTKKTSLQLCAALLVSLFASVSLAGAVSMRSVEKIVVWVLVLVVSYGLWVKNRHALPRKSFATASLILAAFLSFAVMGGVSSKKQDGRVLWQKDPKVKIVQASEQLVSDIAVLREVTVIVSAERQDVFVPLSQKIVSRLQSIASREFVENLNVGSAQQYAADAARSLLEAGSERAVLEEAWDPKRESSWRSLIDAAASDILRAESLLEQSN